MFRALIASPKTFRLAAIAVVAVVGTLLFTSPAHAQSAQDVFAAKQAWQRGRQAMAAGRPADAAEHYLEAAGLHPKAQYQLDLARAVVALGQLVEAAELLHAAASTQDPNSQLAKQAAEKLLLEVEGRIPWVTLDIQGADPSEVTAMLGGLEIDPTTENPVDPGKHTLIVEADGLEPFEKELKLSEGDRETVKVVFAGADDEDEEPEEVAVPDEDDDDSSSTAQVALPLLAFTVGAAGIGVGTVFGIMAFNDTNEIKERCGGTVCPPEEQDALNVSKNNGTISTIAFVVGGAGILGGVILLAADIGGDDETATGPTVEPMIGLGTVGLSGRF